MNHLDGFGITDRTPLILESKEISNNNESNIDEIAQIGSATYFNYGSMCITRTLTFYLYIRTSSQITILLF